MGIELTRAIPAMVKSNRSSVERKRDTYGHNLKSGASKSKNACVSGSRPMFLPNVSAFACSLTIWLDAVSLRAWGPPTAWWKLVFPVLVPYGQAIK
jgi:hypothetical protein